MKLLPLLAALLVSGLPLASAAEKVDLGPTPSAQEKTRLESLSKRGVLVQPLFSGANWQYVNFRGADKPDTALFAFLKDNTSVVELDLSKQPVTDADLAAIATLKNLSKLNLSKTKISDAGVPQIKGLEKLESLNVYGTEIGDASLAAIGELKGLKRVYLFETKVTDEGVRKLAAAKPALKIERGATLVKPPEPPKPEAKPEAKPAAPAKPEAKPEAKPATPAAPAKPEAKPETAPAKPEAKPAAPATPAKPAEPKAN